TLNATMARAGSTALRIPGMGAKASTVETRTSVNRKPRPFQSSTGIARQVPEQDAGIAHQPVHHPRQKQQRRRKKRRQPRSGTESRILDRRHDLRKAEKHARYEADRQQRQAEPESHPQCLAQQGHYHRYIHNSLLTPEN